MARGRLPGQIDRSRGRAFVRPLKPGDKARKSSGEHEPLAPCDADAFEIDYAHLGQRLRDERMRIHRTQEEIAEAVGITPAFLGHIERGERSLSLDKLIRLCHLYGVTIDYLLSDTLPTSSETIGRQIDELLSEKTSQQKTAFMDIMKAVVRNL